MPLRVSNSVERNVTCVPQDLIVIPAGTAVDVLPDATTDREEYAGRYIQNVGASSCYYAIGVTASKVAFNGIMAASGTLDANGYGAGQQFAASNIGQKISVYSEAGTTIAVTLLKRNDLCYGTGNILPQ